MQDGTPNWTPGPAPVVSNIWAELAGNGFNARLSDSLSLDRTVPDHRHPQCLKIKYDLASLPKASIVIVFHNEWLSPLLRSIHSVLNRTPPEILHEIILIDDGSTHDWLKEKLQQHVDLLPKTRLVRLPQRSGLVIARLKGIEEATGEVFVVLDSHIECQEGWLEPLVYRIGQDRKVMVMPQIDSINQETFEQNAGGIGCTLGFLWTLVEHGIYVQAKDRKVMKDETDYTPSPAMAGGLFAGNREYFWEIGGYDRQFGFWGTENLELSFRLWQCGGRLECTICSRVYHIFRQGGHSYSMPGDHLAKNKLRTTLLWMDEYGDFVRRALHDPKVNIGSLTEMRDLRKRLQCKSFDWFLKNVYPENMITDLKDFVGLGKLVTKTGKPCVDSYGGSHTWLLMRVRNSDEEMEIRPMDNLENCLTHSGTLVNCDWHPSEGLWTLDKRTGMIRERNTAKCLTAQQGKITTEACVDTNDNQRWTYDEYHPKAPEE